MLYLLTIAINKVFTDKEFQTRGVHIFDINTTVGSSNNGQEQGTSEGQCSYAWPKRSDAVIA